MNMLKFNKISLAALLLGSMALVMLPGCSSTEETPPPTADEPPPNGSETDIPCEIDMMQPGCTKDDIDL